jgi:2-dehydro-3-deoxyphosphogluconate aldolase / (4S)-4-hydroxy-2-oxoglutarate aldolase
MPENPQSKALFSGRLVCVAVIDRADDAIPLAEALLGGGLKVLEVTFRTDAAAEAIRRVRKALPEMQIGAGTVLNVEQFKRALDAGSQFGVSPGLDEAVLQAAANAKLPFLPGVMTPSDIIRALNFGVKRLKFFPAEAAGGVNMLKALAAPFAPSGVSFVPTGGINADKLASYLALPSVEGVGGSWMAERVLVKEGKWKEIARLSHEASRIALGASDDHRNFSAH